MRRLAPALFRLQSRLLAVLVLVVAVALGTVALVARASTTAEFARYVDTNRQDLQSIAQQVSASTGDRLLVTTNQGRVIVDSSGDLVGQDISPEQAHALGLLLPPPLPVGAHAATDVVFVRRSVGSVAPPDMDPIWTLPVARPLPAEDDREQVFVSAVSRSLMLGVLAGAVAAVVLGLFFARGILRPVNMLTLAVRRMEHGDLSQRVPVTSRDEIGQLAHAFNSMADALARTEQLRRGMVADVAHELRTPLTNLRGYLEALRDGVAEPRREMLESLYEEAVLLTNLVDDLQDLALLEAGGLTLRLRPVDVAALLSAPVFGLTPRAKSEGITLVVDVPSELPRVCVDAQRIGQVVRNLVSNALVYTPAGGTVQVCARECDDMLWVDVRDTGCGIATEHLPNVFERFYRADASRSRATGGAGIGLALVKQFVTAHGGTVNVASTEGVGTCFSFSLPVTPPSVTLRGPGLAPHAATRRR
jgi:signal transduction histidine kinase